ncbi:MAG TPA: hypothetical protein PKC29_05955 [Thermodesulfobacteriota bacterium]|nr:hypothetical protein [Thermodesulfobacteriota bacterium]
MPRPDYLLRKSLFLSLALGITITIFSPGSFAGDAPVVVAQGSKSSGNEVMKAVEAEGL